MPYIKKEDRMRLTQLGVANTAGELNYLITMLIYDYVKYSNWDPAKGNPKPINYQRINDVLGALEGAKAEFYRRVVVPYEESKIAGNGDVY